MTIPNYQKVTALAHNVWDEFAPKNLYSFTYNGQIDICDSDLFPLQDIAEANDLNQLEYDKLVDLLQTRAEAELVYEKSLDRKPLTLINFRAIL